MANLLSLKSLIQLNFTQATVRLTLILLYYDNYSLNGLLQYYYVAFIYGNLCLGFIKENYF